MTDTGPGISAENLELVFAPFERLGAERTTVEGTDRPVSGLTPPGA